MVPSYTLIKEPLRRLCHCLIAFTIVRRGQAPKKAEGRNQGDKMCGGHFIARLAEHFRLINEESLQGLTVVVGYMTMINMDELVRLHIYERLLGILTWVALGLERKQVGAAQADQEVHEKGVQADPTHVLAPQAPLAGAPAPRNIP
nr:hypothetical protein [Tanacetum cinerariifolium]